MKRVLAIIMALALLLGASALADGATLTVQGMGMVKLPPDEAVITFGVRMTSTDIAKAQTEVNATLGKVIDRLKEMGVTLEDIETSSINIYEDYNYREYSASLDGETAYSVENTVSVTIKDIDRAGSYIDAVFEAGANSFSGIYFRISDPSQARERAMALAVQDARNRAEILAEAAGMAVGDMLSMTDGGSVNYYSAEDGLYEKAAVADTGAGFANMVFTSDQMVSAAVTVVYQLSPVEDN